MSKRASVEEVIEKAQWLIERGRMLWEWHEIAQLSGKDAERLRVDIRRLNQAAVRLVGMAADMLEPPKVARRNK